MGDQKGDSFADTYMREMLTAAFYERNMVGAAGFEPTTTSPPGWLSPHDLTETPSIHAPGEAPTRTEAHPEWVARWVTP
jgi:hypothetical protein